MPKIVLETIINSVNIEVVFNLSRSIDLHKISAKSSKEQAISGKTSGLISLDETVTWRAKHFGFYQTLTSKITDFEYPTFFADEMVKGAFANFRHEHFFELQNKKIILKYIFDYKSPFGILGKLADVLFLKKYITNFLIERNQIIKKIRRI
jgi:ligand-binding SRPBCC domain-containing protein